MPTTPFVKSEVADLFSKQGVVLVHCAAKNKLCGNEETNSLTPLGRIAKAIRSRCDLSASTIRIDDTFDRGNYCGHLGLILDPASFGNISVSCPGDAGSVIDHATGKRHANKGLGKNQPDQILQAINDRSGPYNEICTFGFKIVGLFADRDVLAFKMSPPLMGQSNDKRITEWLDEGGQKQEGLYSDHFEYNINTVGRHFPDLPLFVWQTASGAFEIRIFDQDSGTYKVQDGGPVAIGKVYDCTDRY
jgi:hypothetical protein